MFFHTLIKINTYFTKYHKAVIKTQLSQVVIDKWNYKLSLWWPVLENKCLLVFVLTCEAHQLVSNNFMSELRGRVVSFFALLNLRGIVLRRPGQQLSKLQHFPSACNISVDLNLITHNTITAPTHTIPSLPQALRWKFNYGQDASFINNF